MANVKISELTALTTPAAADLIPIVDDSEAASEKTKYMTWANLLAAITGAGKAYTITGAYSAYMPTNGVAANAVFMLGDASTVLWMYLNTAPPGWKVLSTGADTVLGISGGSYSFAVNGGQPDSASAWAITGMTADPHTHTGPSHTHTGPSHTHTVAGSTDAGGAHTHTLTLSSGTTLGSDAPEGSISTSGTTSTAATHTHNINTTTAAGGTGATGAEGTGTTSGPSTQGITSAGTWRPKASIGKLYQLNTA
jgi:hypothetical protein